MERRGLVAPVGQQQQALRVGRGGHASASKRIIWRWLVKVWSLGALLGAAVAVLWHLQLAKPVGGVMSDGPF